MIFFRPWSRAVHLGLLSWVVPVLLAGCAAQQVNKPEVVWPFPPETARVRFVRSFTSETDLSPSGWQSFMRAVTGGSEGLAVYQAMGLAVSDDGKRVYTSCPNSGQVLKFDLEERKVSRILDVEGYEPVRPFDIVLDAEENLYVSDSLIRAVWVYNKENEFVRQIGLNETDRPTGLAIDRERGWLYVVDGSKRDSEHHAVVVYTLAGEQVRTIGKKGGGDGELFYPAYAAVAPNGDLYVGDVMNFRIQVFNADGDFVTKFGEKGAGFGSFGRIKGVAFDTFGNLHVVDGEFGIVQIFNRDHQPLMFFGGRANLVEFFDMPTAITIGKNNNIFVSNFSFSRVNQYEMINTSAEDSFLSPGRKAPEPEPEPAVSPAEVVEIKSGEEAPPADPPADAVPPAESPAEEAPPAAPND